VAREFVKSLRTKDPREAKRLAVPVVERLADWLRAAEAEFADENVHLRDREVATLCGRWLARETERHRDTVGGTAAYFADMASELGEIANGLDETRLNTPAIPSKTPSSICGTTLAHCWQPRHLPRLAAATIPIDIRIAERDKA
jgi:hypothetical protein